VALALVLLLVVMLLLVVGLEQVVDLVVDFAVVVHHFLQEYRQQPTMSIHQQVKLQLPVRVIAITATAHLVLLDLLLLHMMLHRDSNINGRSMLLYLPLISLLLSEIPYGTPCEI
jgi:hypothetical protein